MLQGLGKLEQLARRVEGTAESSSEFDRGALSHAGDDQSSI